jgi:hypothetical protein
MSGFWIGVLCMQLINYGGVAGEGRRNSWCVERKFCEGYGCGIREGKGLGCRESGGERGDTGMLNTGFFGPAVRRLGFGAKMGPESCVGEL